MGSGDDSQCSRELLSPEHLWSATGTLDYCVRCGLVCVRQPLSPSPLCRDVWKPLCHLVTFSSAGRIKKKDVWFAWILLSKGPDVLKRALVLNLPDNLSLQAYWLSSFLALCPHLGGILQARLTCPSWGEGGYPIEGYWPSLWLSAEYLPGVILSQRGHRTIALVIHLSAI